MNVGLTVVGLVVGFAVVGLTVGLTVVGFAVVGLVVIDPLFAYFRATARRTNKRRWIKQKGSYNVGKLFKPQKEGWEPLPGKRQLFGLQPQ